MRARWTRFENLVLAGLVATGVGYLALTLREEVDLASAGPEPSSRPSPERFPAADWQAFENALPPDAWGLDVLVGRSKDGTAIEGMVAGYPYGGREVPVWDGRSDHVVVHRVADFERFSIYRSREPWHPTRWQVGMAGGGVKELSGSLLREEPDRVVVKLESGIVFLPKSSLR